MASRARLQADRLGPPRPDLALAAPAAPTRDHGLGDARIEHEQVVVRRGARSGIYTLVAVHSTRLGPALGGCRLWHYPAVEAGLRDALRLSMAMTFKAAAAGLDLGGGKGVICAPPGPAPSGPQRRAVLADFAELVESLGGRYVTAEDVGTGSADMAVIGETTAHVAGRAVEAGGLGDPSPFTARGVEAAMRACCAHAFGSRTLSGRRVTVVGLGRVGSRLARRLAAAGARLLVSDVDPGKRALLAELPDARWAQPAQALLAPADVLAPCALGGVLDEPTIPGLRATIVCGAANNQLAHDRLASELAARGILYAPDFVANAGGLIHLSAEIHPSAAAGPERVDRLEHDMAAILVEAATSGATPLAVARRHAWRRLNGSSQRV